jgi:hypothetical protein
MWYRRYILAPRVDGPSALFKGRHNRSLLMIRRISIVLLSIGAVSAVGSLAGCSGGFGKGGQVTQRAMEQVQQDHTDEWMAIAGVEGVVIGLFEDKLCIKIFSSVAPEQLRDKIPSTVEGYPVIIEETGTFHKLEQW